MAGRRPALLVAAALAVGTLTHSAPAAAAPIAEEVETAGDGGVLDTLPLDVRPIDVAVEAADVPEFGPTESAAVELTNAGAWHDAGYDGTGVKVGVIDFFDIPMYWKPAEHGPVPISGTTARCFDRGADCTNDFFDERDLGGESHGVAVVEIIRDMAPGAQIFIGQAVTATDYYTLVDWFAANGVQVISRSLGSRYDGPGDGRGELDDVAAHAAAKGIVWINSGGNNAIGRYYRHQVRLLSDRVAFGPSGNETMLQFNGCVALGGVRWANDWDTPATQRTDYDIHLWEWELGSSSPLVHRGSSTLDQRAGAPPLEHIVGNRCPAPGHALLLEVVWNGGDTTGDILEILDYGGGMAAHTQAAYSASTSIVDSKLAAVVAVGAVDPPGSGQVAGYSSQGPTNDGRIAPAVVAPAGFANTVLGTFAGTSASAPVVSGGAALLLDAGSAQPGESLGQVIRNTTIDRGPAGPDSAYGYGEFHLPAPPVPAGERPPSTFVPRATPVRILDTRPEMPIGPALGRMWAGEIRRLPILGQADVPNADVTAVALNVATVAADGPGWVQVLPTGEATVGAHSNINTDGPGQTRANFVVVPVAADGSISIHATTGSHVIVDLLGWFTTAAAEGAAGRFVRLPTAERALDTRHDAPVGPLTSGSSRPVRWPTAVDSGHIAALVVTVTGAGASADGWLQAYPADQPGVIGTTSTVNLQAGGIVANTAIVPVGTAGVAVTGHFAGGGSSHVVVDIVGYITSVAAPPTSGGLFVPMQPGRAFDSRLRYGDLADGEVVTISASNAPGATVPSSASGVVWNVTSVLANRAGWTRGWAAGFAEPVTSSSNWSRPGETRAAAAITGVAGTAAHFRMDDGDANVPIRVAGLVVDVMGYFT